MCWRYRTARDVRVLLGVKWRTPRAGLEDMHVLIRKMV